MVGWGVDRQGSEEGSSSPGFGCYAPGKFLKFYTQICILVLYGVVVFATSVRLKFWRGEQIYTLAPVGEGLDNRLSACSPPRDRCNWFRHAIVMYAWFIRVASLLGVCGKCRPIKHRPVCLMRLGLRDWYRTDCGLNSFIRSQLSLPRHGRWSDRCAGAWQLRLNGPLLLFQDRVSVAANGVSAARGRGPRALQHTRHWLLMLLVLHDWLLQATGGVAATVMTPTVYRSFFNLAALAPISRGELEWTNVPIT